MIINHDIRYLRPKFTKSSISDSASSSVSLLSSVALFSLSDFVSDDNKDSTRTSLKQFSTYVLNKSIPKLGHCFQALGASLSLASKILELISAELITTTTDSFKICEYCIASEIETFERKFVRNIFVNNFER